MSPFRDNLISQSDKTMTVIDLIIKLLYNSFNKVEEGLHGVICIIYKIIIEEESKINNIRKANYEKALLFEKEIRIQERRSPTLPG